VTDERKDFEAWRDDMELRASEFTGRGAALWMLIALAAFIVLMATGQSR
jgi:hypothetical protein